MYERQQLLPHPRALFAIKTGGSPVRGRNGADIFAQHGLKVNIPALRPVTPGIEVWETEDGHWWLEDLARELSTPEYSIANFAAEHGPQGFANNENTKTLGIAIAQQFITSNRPAHEGLCKTSDGLTRDLWLFGTSYGGILLKKAFCVMAASTSPLFRSVYQKIRVCCFFAVPHAGSRLATIFQAGSQRLRKLKEGSTLLEELQFDFEEARLQQRILVINLLEKKHGIDKVVREASASLHAADDYNISVADAGHTDVPRLQPGSAAYLTLIELLRAELRGQFDIAAPQPVIEPSGVATFPADQNLESASELLQDRRLQVLGSKQGSLEIAFVAETGISQIAADLEGTPVESLKWFDDGTWYTRDYRQGGGQLSQRGHVTELVTVSNGDNLYLLYVDRESADVLLMAAGRFSCLEELSEEDLELRSYLRIPTEPQARVFKLPTDAQLVNGIVVSGFATPLLLALGSYACAAPFGDVVLGKDHVDSEEEDDGELQGAGGLPESSSGPGGASSSLAQEALQQPQERLMGDTLRAPSGQKTSEITAEPVGESPHAPSGQASPETIAEPVVETPRKPAAFGSAESSQTPPKTSPKRSPAKILKEPSDSVASRVKQFPRPRRVPERLAQLQSQTSTASSLESSSTSCFDTIRRAIRRPKRREGEGNGGQ